jgi:hypothetical protein
LQKNLLAEVHQQERHEHETICLFDLLLRLNEADVAETSQLNLVAGMKWLLGTYTGHVTAKEKDCRL